MPTLFIKATGRHKILRIKKLTGKLTLQEKDATSSLQVITLILLREVECIS